MESKISMGRTRPQRVKSCVLSLLYETPEAKDYKHSGPRKKQKAHFRDQHRQSDRKFAQKIIHQKNFTSYRNLSNFSKEKVRKNQRGNTFEKISNLEMTANSTLKG